MTTITEKFLIDFGSHISSKFPFVYGWIESDRDIRVKWQQDDHSHPLIENIQDHVAVVRYLTKKLNFVDSQKVCIWGKGTIVLCGTIYTHVVLVLLTKHLMNTLMNANDRDKGWLVGHKLDRVW